MNFQIFANKLKIAGDTDQDDFIDLLGKTVEIPRQPNKDDLLEENYEVKENEEQRIDIISYKFYANTDYAEAVLKLNGISNPYYLYKGLRLKIPNERFIRLMIKKPVLYENTKNDRLKIGTSENIIRQYELPKNTKAEKRLEFLRKKYNKNVFLPPSLRTSQEADTNTNKTAKDRITLKESLNVTSNIRKRP